MTTRSIRRPEVLTKTGLSKTTVHNLEAVGDFPRHWMQTPRVAVWDEAEVDQWNQRRKAARAAATQAPDQALRKTRPGRGKKRAQAAGRQAASTPQPHHWPRVGGAA